MTIFNIRKNMEYAFVWGEGRIQYNLSCYLNSRMQRRKAINLLSCPFYQNHNKDTLFLASVLCIYKWGTISFSPYPITLSFFLPDPSLYLSPLLPHHFFLSIPSLNHFLFLSLLPQPITPSFCPTSSFIYFSLCLPYPIILFF